MAAPIITKKLRVFFPRHCLLYDSGLIVGWQLCGENAFVALTVICSSFTSSKLSERFSKLRGEISSSSLSVCGVWINEKPGKSVSEVLAETIEDSLLSTEGRIIVCLPRNAIVPQLYILENKCSRDGAVIVLYNQPTENAPLKIKAPSAETSEFWRQLQRAEEKPSTELSKILELLNRSCKEEGKISAMMKNTDTVESFTGGNSLFSLISEVVKKIHWLCSCLNFEMFSRWQLAVRFLSCWSVGVLQCLTRVKQMKALCMCFIQPKRDEEDLSKVSSLQSGENCTTKQEVFPIVWFGSLISAMLIDISLGILIVSWIFGNGYNLRATDFMMEKTNTVAELLSALLDWLKDAPAGLKLNKQLAECLSTFFLYHIYLWQIYLSCIEPYLQIITKVIITSGCLGVTFLLSMVSEVLSVLTLHIYCFYVYAARLYNFQLKKLITLFRLFTGRRWNIEKNQVESVPFKADSLFLGTLFFTILLFLLPTTAMYYAVFTVLRLMVLLVKGAINRVINTMNNLPVFPLAVACVKPDLLPGGITFELLEPTIYPEEKFNIQNGCSRNITTPLPSVCLVLHNQLVPLAKLISHYLIDIQPDDPTSTQSCLTLMSKLAKGELIYPWVKTRHSK
ncbi:Phosphatidylinositol N-acetylglucosaminyltransferase subunit Q [Acropora cervicornis]|uniref:Phosphatidylinositol N-acetylglucosaminyltransferase subunit Q n=1 Tax=Acropora cervicornis TaxID=6130 RepID=A0AAD9VDJ5_ACRCE|nr:Phosphatidylinositol N-acetylglucosaminyltransferase subunit Q [Acropora cervicornis]